MLEIITILVFMGLLGIIIVVKPEIATLIVTFLIYTNIPAILKKNLGLPEAVAGGFILLLFIPLLIYLFFRRQKLVVDYILLLMLAFLGVVIISSLFAVDINLAFDWVFNYIYEGILLYFLFINVIRNRATLKQVMYSMILACTLLGSLSLFQDLTGTYKNDYFGLAQRKSDADEAEDEEKFLEESSRETREKVGGKDRAGGSLGGANRYAQVMLVVLPFALFFFWNEKKSIYKMVMLFSGLMILSGILLSYSRGAFVTLILMIMVLVVMRYVKISQILMIIPILTVLVLVASPGYVSRIQTIFGAAGLFTESAKYQPDSVTKSRTTEMLAALTCFFDHPLLGVGPGQYTPFYSREYHMDPDIAFKSIPKARRAHILYFEIAAETGIFGFLLFMGMIAVVMLRLHITRKQGLARGDTEMAFICSALFLGIIGYLGTAIFLHLSYIRYFWLLMAVASAAVHVFNQEMASQPDTGPEQSPTDRENTSAPETKPEGGKIPYPASKF